MEDLPTDPAHESSDLSFWDPNASAQPSGGFPDWAGSFDDVQSHFNDAQNLAFSMSNTAAETTPRPANAIAPQDESARYAEILEGPSMPMLREIYSDACPTFYKWLSEELSRKCNVSVPSDWIPKLLKAYKGKEGKHASEKALMERRLMQKLRGGKGGRPMMSGPNGSSTLEH